MSKAVLEAEIDSNIGELNKGLKQASDNTEQLEKGAKKAGRGFSGIGKAIKGVGTALKAAGIGLVVAAFAKLFELFGQNQKVMDTFKTAMTAINIAFNDFIEAVVNNVTPITEAFKALFEDPTQAIKDFGDAIKEGFIDRFNQVGDVITNLGSGLKKLFSGDFKGAVEDVKQAGVEAVDVLTGQDDSLKEITETVTNYTKSVVDGAKAQVQANKAAQFAELEVRKLQAENLKAAEDERQIRDNVNLTFQERIDANERLSKILEKQQNAQKAALQTEIDALALAVKTNANDENRLALGRKKVEMLELEEAINGQLSEQLTNQVALENELRDAKEQIMLEGMSDRERELADIEANFNAQVRLAKQAGEDTTALERKFAKDKAQIKRDETNEILDASSQLAGALGALAGENKELAVASAIIDTYTGANKAFAQGGPLGFISAAAVIAAGLANVQKIMSTDVGSGGGGGASFTSAQAPAPQMMSGQFELTGGVQPEPLKAFVVTDEMTNSQNQLANIRRRSTI